MYIMCPTLILADWFNKRSMSIGGERSGGGGGGGGDSFVPCLELASVVCTKCMRVCGQTHKSHTLINSFVWCSINA